MPKLPLWTAWEQLNLLQPWGKGVCFLWPDAGPVEESWNCQGAHQEQAGDAGMGKEAEVSVCVTNGQQESVLEGSGMLR